MTRTAIQIPLAVLAWIVLILSAGPAFADHHEASSIAADSSAATASPSTSPETTALDLWIEQQLAYRGLPGLALAIVHDQEVAWSRSYGWADLEGRVPMTAKTPFRMGSISKLFTATAVLQLRDAGRLRLDDPVSKHLPWFSVETPEGSPAITVRQLLTHTTGAGLELVEQPLPVGAKQIHKGRRGLRRVPCVATVQFRIVKFGIEVSCGHWIVSLGK